MAERLRASHIVIATGSRPYHPPDVDFDHPRVRDSDTLLRLTHTPSSITIYGAGVIGCEYASIMASLGTKVNLVDTRDRLLSFLDDEITDALSYHLRQQGVVIRHDETYAAVDGRRRRRCALLQVRQEASRPTSCCGPTGAPATPMVSAWRRSASRPTGAANSMSIRAIRRHCPTSTPWATWPDLRPWPAPATIRGASSGLTSPTANATGPWSRPSPPGSTRCPEISSVGRTERELTAAQIPYEVANAQFKHIARAQITGHTVGMLKLLFHRETLEILGIHCFGEQASEIVHIGQAIMAQPGSANTLAIFRPDHLQLSHHG